MILDHVEPVDIYRELKGFYGKEFICMLDTYEYEDLERAYAVDQGYVESEGYYYQQGDVELNALLVCGPEPEEDVTWLS